jgi:hypothetical protein
MPAVLPGSPHMSRGREHQKSDLQTLIGPRVKRDWYYLPATPQFSSSCACRPLVAGGRNKQHHPRVAATHVFLVARTRCRRHLFPDPKCSAPMPAMHRSMENEILLSSPADDANILRDNGDLVRAVGAYMHAALFSFSRREHLNYPDEVEI